MHDANVAHGNTSEKMVVKAKGVGLTEHFIRILEAEPGLCAMVLFLSKKVPFNVVLQINGFGFETKDWVLP